MLRAMLLVLRGQSSVAVARSTSSRFIVSHLSTTASNSHQRSCSLCAFVLHWSCFHMHATMAVPWLEASPWLIHRLAGKVAVITGAASGIGRATATEFVRNGAKVILTDTQDDLGAAVAAELGPAATYARCDVADEAQIAAAVDLAVARHGRLDILHWNAGVTGSVAPGPVAASIDLADFDRTMAVNARSVVAGVKHAARVMVPRSAGGCVLCTASTAGVLGGVMPPVYSVTKATVIAVVRAVAGDLALHGVRVNAISPHAIATPFGLRALAEMLPGASDEELRLVAERDLSVMGGVELDAEDVARAAVYLASDEAKYVTGHNLVIDGGFTVGKPVISMH